MKKVIGTIYRREGKLGDRKYQVIQCQECGAITYERRQKRVEAALSRSCKFCGSNEGCQGNNCCGLSRKHLREYNSFKAMHYRCLDISCPAYKDYGGRGITICPEWLNNFKQFYSDMGDRPDGTSLDRIDNDKGYSLDNCRWATWDEQAANKRSNGGQKRCEGAKGYTQRPDGKFFARIYRDGKDRYIGVFDTAEEAHAAYLKAKKAKYS